MRQLESKLQQEAVRWFRLQFRNEIIFSSPNEGKRTLSNASRLKAEGMMSGVADLQILSAQNGYHGLFIEIKYGKGRQTESQKWFQKVAEQNGYKYVICRSFDEFKKEIEDYLQSTKFGIVK